MLIPLIRTRLMDTLGGTPVVLETLLAGVGDADPIWDRRFVPDRFTLREVLAHLVDYDAIWTEYVDKALASGKNDRAEVPTYTPDSVAAKRDYAAADPRASLRDFAAGRARLTAKLRALGDDDWTAFGISSPRHGNLNIDEMATLYVAHDGYHTRQVAEYLTEHVLGNG